MGDSVDTTDVHLVDGQTAVIGAHGHARPRFAVGAIVIGSGQVLEHQLHADAGIVQPGAPLPDTDIGLDGVGECIHAGGRSNVGRQAEHQVRVQRGRNRQQSGAGNNAFEVSLGLGNNRSHGGLRAGTGGGGYYVEFQHLVLHLAKAHPVPGRLVAGGGGGDNLGRIDR